MYMLWVVYNITYIIIIYTHHGRYGERNEKFSFTTEGNAHSEGPARQPFLGRAYLLMMGRPSAPAAACAAGGRCRHGCTCLRVADQIYCTTCERRTYYYYYYIIFEIEIISCAAYVIISRRSVPDAIVVFRSGGFVDIFFFAQRFYSIFFQIFDHV